MHEQSDSGMTEAEDQITRNVETSLRRGELLRNWWDNKRRSGGFAQEFPLVRTFNRPDRGYAFFDVAPVDGDSPVMGSVAEEFFDQPKGVDLSKWRAEVREFVLRYFMRVSDFHQPDVYAGRDQPTPPAPPFSGFSWCPERQDSLAGFGYSQLYYKRRDTGQIGKFAEKDRFAIVDVRELNETYEWVVLKVRIFDFIVAINPPARLDPINATGVHVGIPFEEETLVVLSSAFTNNSGYSADGIAGRYGFGYSILNQPSGTDLLAYGPGHFHLGFQLFTFEVDEGTGRIRSRRVFVVNRPERILNVPLNPWTLGCRVADLAVPGLTESAGHFWRGLCEALPGAQIAFDPVLPSIRLLNNLTGGAAADRLCISKSQMETLFLQQHFKQNYDLIVGALRTWREVPDWLDTGNLPIRITAGLGA